MDHSLINPNQIFNYGIPISDNPFDRNKDFGIYHDKIFVPFSTKVPAIYSTPTVPTDE